MDHATLKSSRYEISINGDRFSRNHLFIEEARKYRSVLECGCSTGFISRHLAAAGTRVVGIEIDTEAAEEARQFCARVLSLDLNRPDWSKDLGERFDLVTYGDVLEHLLEPQAVLRETKNVLAPGGRVFISLPNIAYWTMRAKLLLGRFEYESMGLLDYTHLRFFTFHTARKMIEQAGYRIVRFHPVMGSRFTSHFRPMWQRLTNLFLNSLALQMLFLAEPMPIHMNREPPDLTPPTTPEAPPQQKYAR
jgi:2-polyprenyl-3-methyl-5-hydroxy-6-metoxy-1,4-benzoquinol methylase